MAMREAGAAVAKTALRALGGNSVTLSLTAGSGAGEQQPGLGLRAPAINEVELFPVVVRTRADEKMEIVVEARVLESATGATGDAMAAMLMGSARVTLEERSRKVLGVERECLGGSAYLYRLIVEG